MKGQCPNCGKIAEYEVKVINDIAKLICLNCGDPIID